MMLHVAQALYVAVYVLVTLFICYDLGGKKKITDLKKIAWVTIVILLSIPISSPILYILWHSYRYSYTIHLTAHIADIVVTLLLYVAAAITIYTCNRHRRYLTIAGRQFEAFGKRNTRTVVSIVVTLIIVTFLLLA